MLFRHHRHRWFTLFQPHPNPNMYGSRVIGIRFDSIGTGIEAIGLGHRMSALVGGVLVMNAGSSLKVTGKAITGGHRMTTTGTVTGTGIFARKSTVRVGVGATIANSGGSTTDLSTCAPQKLNTTCF
jgi:hypothetical protein